MSSAYFLLSEKASFAANLFCQEIGEMIMTKCVPCALLSRLLMFSIRGFQMKGDR